jgi:restriction endonuclease S subunit
MIPDGWLECSFAEIAKIDVARDLNETSFSSDLTDSHTHPVYSNTVQNRGLYGYYDFQEYDKDSLTVVGRGIGLGTAFSRTEGFGAIGRLLVLSPKNNAFNVHYLADYINFCIRIHFENGAIPQLPGSTFSNYRAILPPIHEQNKIVEILSTWDLAIEVQERLIANARAQKKALMQTLLTKKKRLPKFQGEWKKILLDEIFLFKRGQGLSKDAVVINGVRKCILYGELYTYYSEVIGEIKSRTNSNEGFPSKVGDVLIPASTTTTGIDLAKAAALLEDGILLSGDINVLRPKNQNLSSPFFAYLLTHILKHDIASRAQGITIVHVYGSDLKTMVADIPDYAEQHAIAAQIMAADELILSYSSQFDALRQEKSALMQQLLTGKRRVKIREFAK